MDGNKTASCAVFVKAKASFHLEASDSTFNLKPDETVSFKIYSVEGEKRTEITNNKDTSYRVDNGLVTVKSGRIIAGKKTGQSVITVSYKGAELPIPVTVEKEEIQLEARNHPSSSNQREPRDSAFMLLMAKSGNSFLLARRLNTVQTTI